jgi:hypothetical protein
VHVAGVSPGASAQPAETRRNWTTVADKPIVGAGALAGGPQGRTLVRKLLIGAAASAMLAPAAAHAQTSGYVDTAYEYSETSGNTWVQSWNLGAAVEHDFATGWSIQGDGRSTKFDNGAITMGANYAALHVSAAVSPNADVAAFFGFLDRVSSDAPMVGLEARVHQGQWSLQGSAGYAQFTPSIGSSEVWDARVLGAWFFNPDTALTPSIAYSEWHETFSFTRTQLGVGVGVTHRLNNGLQWFASYLHSDIDANQPFGYTADTARVGLRLHLNGGDLQTITNEGASWYGASGLYELFGRW